MCCSVEGCDRAHYGKGLCNTHYQRLRKHGHPLSGGIFRGPTGEIDGFLAAALASDTVDCITWPFSCDDYGYGKMNRNGRTQHVHVYVTKMKRGPKPPRHDACHSCGNGHMACVNWRHLDWGTRKKNVHDSIEHGTDNFFGLGPLNERSAA